MLTSSRYVVLDVKLEKVIDDDPPVGEELSITRQRFIVVPEKVVWPLNVFAPVKVVLSPGWTMTPVQPDALHAVVLTELSPQVIVVTLDSEIVVPKQALGVSTSERIRKASWVIVLRRHNEIRPPGA